MSKDGELRIRPGRIRSRGQASSKRFVAQVLQATQKASGIPKTTGARGRTSNFGRGRAASVAANRTMHRRARQVTVKARVVRHRAASVPLAAHLAYLQRDGMTRDGERGQVFDAGHDAVDARGFAERTADDRHQFRFIVAPEDGAEMADLRAFTRDLMSTAERDLGTKLDWVGVEHHNTGHPHVHVLVRGRTDDGADLVISRDYISEGLRARAQSLMTLELGPRTERDIRRGLEAQVDADRWTQLDRDLARRATAGDGVVDLRPDAATQPDWEHHARIGRLQKLERLGLATSIGPAQWSMKPETESILRALGERDDIIKRLHRVMAGRAPADWVVAGEREPSGVVGKLVERGLDDELRGSAYAIVDGVDGRVHHLRLPDLDATTDAQPGAIVELRRFRDAAGKERVALAVRSDLDLASQVKAEGATWLDRRLVDRTPLPLADSGFGAEVRSALDQRSEQLAEHGVARRQAQRVIFANDLLATLQRCELAFAGGRLATESGLPFRPVAEGEQVAGLYRSRVTLASGRFAMIDDGLGFSLVPWTPSLDRHLGTQVSGAMTASGVDWSFTRKRGIAL